MSNGKIERFHRTISEECLRTKSPITIEDFKEYIALYVKHYNTERLHASLSYLTLEDFLLGKQKEKLVFREAKLQKAEQVRNQFWIARERLLDMLFTTFSLLFFLSIVSFPLKHYS